jgi:hypothetical protein
MKLIAILAALILAQDRPGDKKGKPPDRAPKVGSEAPNFKLKTLGAPDTEVELSSFKDKKPVVLIFGSYT